MTRVGVFGGTFDPVHLGHVAVGRAAVGALGLEQLRLVPSRMPPHRIGPEASGYHRFAMTALVALGEPAWTASDAELGRDGPSFTYDTLTAVVGEGLRPTQIFFLIGADAFAEIATWWRFPAVLDLAHFVVVSRTGVRPADLQARVPSLIPRFTTIGAVPSRTTTGIVPLAADTPDVSSTAIRARAARGGSLTDLVTEPVGRYIRRHGLYAMPTDR